MLSKSFLAAAAAAAAAAVAAAVFAPVAQAHQFQLGAIAIGHPYARATAPGQPVGGAFLKLDNRGADDRLMAVSSPVSASVEMHSMAMDGNVMRMRQVDAIDVPGGRVVELKPGGLHMMFVGLKAPLKAGEKFPLLLRFEKAGEVTVQVLVESPKAADVPASHSH